MASRISRTLAAAGAAVCATLAAGIAPASAGLDGVGPQYTQVDLTREVDGHRLTSSALRGDGAVFVSEQGQPFGDGYLHLVPVGARDARTGPANRIGDLLEIGGMAMRGGILYALSTISSPDPAQQNKCPLYRIDPATGRTLGVVIYWDLCKSPMNVDPLNGDLLLQDDNKHQGGAIVDFNPDTTATTVIVPNPPSLDIESFAFDPGGQTLFLGNSNNDPSGLGVVSADGIYAYNRAGIQQYFIGLTTNTGSPDAIVFGKAGTCFAGMLIYAADPARPNRSVAPPPAGIYSIRNPSAAAQPQQLASAANPNEVQLWMVQDLRGNPVISHGAEVTALGCPVPPPVATPPAAVQPAPVQKPQPLQKPTSGGSTTTDTATRAGGIGIPGPPSGLGIQTAPAAATQPAAQAQSVANAAPNAGLIDAPEDEHALSLSAAALPLPVPPWVLLGLGATAVTLMAAGTYVACLRHDPDLATQAGRR